jgi:uncharacterized repeat protein (TIGR03806 family)
MKKLYYLKYLLLLAIVVALNSCGSDEAVNYTEIPSSPVNLNFNANPFPYTKLSEYNFFEGELKNLEPVYKVLPYDLNSTLFTDYAHKSRFIWMPPGAGAVYTADDEVLNFPSGTILIKNFYYDNVQPENTRRIIETRLMIKKNSQWIFANYVWNDEQTEAFLDMGGSFTTITWNEGDETKTANYRIPSATECFTCHKSDGLGIPIGPKPQNLNRNFNYGGISMNQLQKLQAEGYLGGNVPADIASTVDWTDTGKPLNDRVRSYLDINCAHCHREGSHCDYRPMRLAFSETTDPVNLGVCVPPDEIIPDHTHIVASGYAMRSVMRHRLNSTNEAVRMPLLGRTLVHDEAVDMLTEWINSMDTPCP